MTNQKHTPEPWALWSRRPDTIVRAKDVDTVSLTDKSIAYTCYNPVVEPNARRIVACVNACAGLDTDLLEQFGIDGAFCGQIYKDNQLFYSADGALGWIQKANTLHRQVEILYVVDGYTVTVTWDGYPISEDFHGETILQAISNARVGFDLDAKPVWVGGDRLWQEPIDRKFSALEKQRDELLAALETVGMHTITDEDGDEVEVLFGDIGKIRAAIAKAKGGTR